MGKWLKSFFSTENTVNENTVVGTVLLICFVVALFVAVPADKFYTVAAAMVACYGFGTLKK